MTATAASAGGEANGNDTAPGAATTTTRGKHDNMIGATKSFFAGGAAGAIAKTVIAPLDRVKILFQISHMPFSFRAVLRELQRTATEEGLRALFKGNGAQVLRVYPYSGVQLMSFDQYSKLIYTLRPGERPASAHVSHDPHGSPGSRLSPLEKLTAGSMAGATSVICTYPLDLMRARLAVSVESATGAEMYRRQGMLRTFFHMYNQHGVTSFYRGMTPTLLGIVPYAGITFMAFEHLKQLWRENFGDIGTLGRLICGGVAGFAGQSSTYPLDVVRRRMQTEGFSPIHAHNDTTPAAAAPAPPSHPRAGYHTMAAGRLGAYSSKIADSVRSFTSTSTLLSPTQYQKGGMVDTMQRLVRRDGVRGLFKGLSLNLIKGPIGVGISFTTYDLLKRVLEIE